MCPIRITPFLKGVANCLSATDALSGNPRQILLYGLCRRLSILLLAFYRFHCFSGRFGPDFSQVAPEQHHPFSALREYSPNTALFPLPAALSHIHSKTACRGFKSFCPCHKTGGNSGLLPVFFLHVLHGFVVHFGSDTGFSHLV